MIGLQTKDHDEPSEPSLCWSRTGLNPAIAGFRVLLGVLHDARGPASNLVHFKKTHVAHSSG